MFLWQMAPEEMTQNINKYIYNKSREWDIQI